MLNAAIYVSFMGSPILLEYRRATAYLFGNPLK
jgi:hypothetical protein